MHNLSKNLAREWAPKRVRVNLLVPGFFPAEQNRAILTPERTTTILGHIVLMQWMPRTGRLGAVVAVEIESTGDVGNRGSVPRIANDTR